MSDLKAHLVKLIKFNGPIPISTFMTEALTNPKFGYYLNKTPTKVDKQDCMHLQIPSLFLNATGKISPCCYMGNTVQYTDVDIETEFNKNNYRNVCLKSCGK
jgi:hypothetical protein